MYYFSGRTSASPYYKFNYNYELPTLVRGQQYIFKENGVGSFHPFNIGTRQRTNKITGFPLNHGTTSEVTITVPSSGSLYYWCGFHQGMTQQFTLTDAPSKCSGNTNSAEDVTCAAGTALKSGSDTIDKDNDPQSNCCTTAPIIDTTAPSISILDNNPLTIEVGTTYTDAGASCVDTVDGNILPTSTSTVNTVVPGSYTVTYNCVDLSGNAASVVRTVNVVVISGKCSGNTNSAEDVICDAGTVLKDNPNLISHNNDKQNNCCVVGQEITFDNQVKTYTICSGESASARVTWGGYHNVCELSDQTTFDNPPASNENCNSGTERHAFENKDTVRTLSNLGADLGHTRYFICSKHPGAKFKVT